MQAADWKSSPYLRDVGLCTASRTTPKLPAPRILPMLYLEQACALVRPLWHSCLGRCHQTERSL